MTSSTSGEETIATIEYSTNDVGTAYSSNIPNIGIYDLYINFILYIIGSTNNQ